MPVYDDLRDRVAAASALAQRGRRLAAPGRRRPKRQAGAASRADSAARRTGAASHPIAAPARLDPAPGMRAASAPCRLCRPGRFCRTAPEPGSAPARLFGIAGVQVGNTGRAPADLFCPRPAARARRVRSCRLRPALAGPAFGHAPIRARRTWPFCRADGSRTTERASRAGARAGQSAPPFSRASLTGDGGRSAKKPRRLSKNWICLGGRSFLRGSCCLSCRFSP